MLRLGPLSTVAVVTYRRSTSTDESACLALLIADSINFLTMGAPDLVVKLSSSRACATFFPRTRFTITRAFRGAILAKRRAALLSMAIVLLNCSRGVPEVFVQCSREKGGAFRGTQLSVLKLLLEVALCANSEKSERWIAGASGDWAVCRTPQPP